MWQSIGLTLLVIVATLACVLLFMLCGECPKRGRHLSAAWSEALKKRVGVVRRDVVRWENIDELGGTFASSVFLRPVCCVLSSPGSSLYRCVRG